MGFAKPFARPFASPFGQSLGQSESSAVAYWFRHDFPVARTAPMSSPQAAEPGPGVFTFTDTGNKWSESSDTLQGAQPAAANDPRGFSQVVADLPGRAFHASITPGGSNINLSIGWVDSPAGNYPTDAIRFVAGSQVLAFVNGVDVTLGYNFTPGTTYKIVINRITGGSQLFITGGIFGTGWRLLFINPSSLVTSIRGGLGHTGASANTYAVEYLRGRDLPAPFNTNFGIAILNSTVFTQSLGAELVTNGNFASWSANNPTGWTVLESVPNQEVSQVGSGQAHGGVGSGFVNVFSDGTAGQIGLHQNILTLGQWYELSETINLITVGGNMNAYLGGSDGPVLNLAASTGQKKRLKKSLSGGNFFAAWGSVTTTDITFDDVSVKAVTPNPIETAVADGLFDFTFTLPASPIAGERIEWQYRVVDDSNYWAMVLVRNDANTNWDFTFNRVSANVYTSELSVNSVGNVTMLRAIADGNLHDVFTLVGSTWTKRGGQINNATHNTATGVRTVYHSTFTPVQRTVYPLRSAVYDSELNKV